MDQNINIRFRVWVDKGELPYLGIGRIVLLENIIEHGSITKGAEAINMSYRKAWQLVEDMNKLSNKPLVEKRLGGKEGGGAIVTDEGRKIIKKFYELQSQVEDFLQGKLQEVGFE
ncbi:MAG: LysR family transcriptional regulator [Bacteroidales bacterium]|nr:LysR family transcriptional regulator [Bacteroidales bacterium]